MWNMNRRQLGKRLAAAAVLVLVAQLVTALSDPTRGSRSCPPTPPNEPKAAVLQSRSIYAENVVLHLNGSVCIGFKAETYFEAERTAAATATRLVDTATADLELARSQADLPTRQKLVEDALKRLKAAHEAEAALPASKTISLFIDGVRTPVSKKVYIQESDWRWEAFKLVPPTNADSEEGKQWRQILSATPIGGLRQVSIGLGDNDASLPRKFAIVKDMTFRAYDWVILALSAAGLAMLAAGLVLSGWDTGLLRDPAPPPPGPPPAGPTPPGTGTPPAGLPPFSLARTQFAFWLFLVTGGFLFIWLTTGQFLGVVTGGVLTLLGISATSGLAAVLIDPRPNPNPSRGFLIDILSDGTSVVLHRVQMLAWTLILGLIFLWTVTTSFTFPSFDTNLLLMAGITSGIYLGFKFPEK